MTTVRYPQDRTESREQRLFKLEAEQKKRQQLLQQQMEHQQLLVQRQMYEQQMQRQRQMLEQQRQTVGRRKTTNVKKPDVKKVEPRADALKKTRVYDQYAGAESTSGYSVFTDKYKIANAQKKRSETPTKEKPEPASSSAGVQLDKGQFATPLAVVPAVGIGAVVASSGARQHVSDVDVNIAESCPEDFMETMFMAPASPPTPEEQKMISDGVTDMAIASSDAFAKDSCGILMPADDDTDNVAEVPDKDWYGKTVPAAQESFVGDFFHTLWTCR